MPKITGLSAAVLLAASLGAANAQPAPGAGQPQPRQDMPHSMPMQGQGDTAQGGCPMMRRSAAMEERVRRLEERLGIPTPPQPPTPPGAPG